MNLIFAYNNHGLAKSALGEKKGAIADYSKAIQLDPNSAYAYIGRGLAKSDLGDKEGAIADYKIAIQLDPNYALAYNNRGNGNSDLGDKEGAIKDMEQAAILYEKQAKIADYEDTQRLLRLWRSPASP